MRYLIYHNLNRFAGFDGFQPSDPMWIDPTEYTIAADHDVTVWDGEAVRTVTSADLEAVFARHNRDDRPDGQTAPSLSVGDVIAVTNMDRGGQQVTHPLHGDRIMRAEFFAVESVGFSRPDGPGVVSDQPTYLAAVAELDATT